MLQTLFVVATTILPIALLLGLGLDVFNIKKTLGNDPMINYKKSIEGVRKGWGLQIFLALLEKPIHAMLGPIGIAWLFYKYLSLPLSLTILLSTLYPMFFVVMIFCLYLQSQTYGENSENTGPDSMVESQKNKYIQFCDKSFQKRFQNEKIPIETAIEAFMDGRIEFKCGDNMAGSKNNKLSEQQNKQNTGTELTVLETLRNRYSIFKFNFTQDQVKSCFSDLLYRVWKHDDNADKADVSDVYNRGNDFYGWFLCDRMLYSVGLWDSSDDKQFENKDTLMSAINNAQTNKLNKICKDLSMMRPGMEHLDLGCGWGALIMHATRHFKVKSTGITLSKEQDISIKERIKKDNAELVAKGEPKCKEWNNNIEVKVINAWEWLSKCQAEGIKYDVITCLEMSEHIGIRDYQKFLALVRDCLKDDGIFYLQIAGLRRNWQYEDIHWGLFMNRYVFPGADASCPLYWDIEQLERGGFEVHSVANEGVHYSLTIRAWYHFWCWNKDTVVAKYGEKSWRNWSIFLAWSHLIAMQGSSTVYMINMTKNLPCDARSRNHTSKVKGDMNALEAGVLDYGIDRAKLWVDKVRTGWERCKWEQ